MYQLKFTYRSYKESYEIRIPDAERAFRVLLVGGESLILSPPISIIINSKIVGKQSKPEHKKNNESCQKSFVTISVITGKKSWFPVFPSFFKYLRN